MPLWLVIMIAGAAGSGFLFMKARQQAAVNVKKKVKRGRKDVIAAAKGVAKRPSTMPVSAAKTSTEEVHMSQDLSTRVAHDIEEVMRSKGL